ncbi:phosphoenolpyruvate carboxylase [Bellilinea sp.]|uniref:phosphoenolpyruvate carboxylase n=1 Tax=Bellilinea sp. TaxID=2838785 RepID=UPI002ADE577B|nr:phosphoenolpyruvate carboxylase [Bellilinea sp.]
MVHIPRCMSTQHPDNVQVPFFSDNAELQGEDEVQEAYYVFSHLGCDEQMWDYEGKEVDNFVIKKLLTTYESYFRHNQIGRDVFITPRIPNPAVERSEAKILLETLGSIPRSYDAAEIFQAGHPAPIFEVILPMTVSAEDINRIYVYYEHFVAGRNNTKLPGTDFTIGEWLGQFRPERIHVIPLFEAVEHMLSAAEVMEEYLRDKPLEYHRVFLARSDPAMNSGLVSTVLANKIALQRLDQLEKRLGKPLYPILGVGSAPFRGHLKPSTVEQVVQEYPSVQTFTIQSAFKYDYPALQVGQAIRRLHELPRRAAQAVDEKRCFDIMEKYTQAYREAVMELAGVINNVAAYVPRRRKRKLHIGLFGYSRNVNGVSLPRAISFTAALYTIGLPPELLGLNSLSNEDLAFLRQTYINFEADLQAALRYADLDNPFLSPGLRRAIEHLGIKAEVNQEHLEISRRVVEAVRNNRFHRLDEWILQAANLRQFLG